MSGIKKVGIFYNNSTLASIQTSNFPIIIASHIRKYFEFSVPENTKKNYALYFVFKKKIKAFLVKISRFVYEFAESTKKIEFCHIMY